MIYLILVIFVVVFGSVVFLIRQNFLKMCGSKIKVMDLKNPVMPEILLISLTCVFSDWKPKFILQYNTKLFYNVIPNAITAYFPGIGMSFCSSLDSFMIKKSLYLLMKSVIIANYVAGPSDRPVRT